MIWKSKKGQTREKRGRKKNDEQESTIQILHLICNISQLMAATGSINYQTGIICLNQCTFIETQLFEFRHFGSIQGKRFKLNYKSLERGLFLLPRLRSGKSGKVGRYCSAKTELLPSRLDSLQSPMRCRWGLLSWTYTTIHHRCRCRL